MSSEIVTLEEERFVRLLCFERVVGFSRPFPQQEHGAAILLECVGMQSSTIDRRLKLAQVWRKNTFRISENVLDISVPHLLASNTGSCISHSNQYIFQYSQALLLN